MICPRLLAACVAILTLGVAAAGVNRGSVDAEDPAPPPPAQASRAEDAIAARADGGGPAAAEVDVQIVDSLHARYGVHPGFRSNHSKGVVTTGRFTPARGAANLSRSPLFAGGPVPVTARFSDAGGLPHVPDASPAANPHGMAVKFHLPGGAETDIVANALKFFTVGTPEDFRDLQLANAAPVPPGMKRSPQLEAFLKAHPSVERANATLGVPASFADQRYFGINAFVFVNAAGQRQAVRYVLEPDRVVHLDRARAAEQPANYLFDELPRRLAQAPVRFRLRAQLASLTDQTKDPTQPWPDDRPVAELGTITVEKVLPDSEAAQRRLLFTPGRLTDGIEPSDDPLIAARDGAYAVSFSHRSSAEQTGPQQLEHPAAAPAAGAKRP